MTKQSKLTWTKNIFHLSNFHSHRKKTCSFFSLALVLASRVSGNLARLDPNSQSVSQPVSQSAISQFSRNSESNLICARFHAQLAIVLVALVGPSLSFYYTYYVRTYVYYDDWSRIKQRPEYENDTKYNITATCYSMLFLSQDRAV